MVYDCIPFFNEIDILLLRLHIMDPLVDRFVIAEATMTFSGQPKELFFDKHRQLFEAFLPKITHIVIDDSPTDIGTHERDRYQKNQLIKGLKDVTEEDIIIFGDCDEIPDPETLRDLIAHFDPTKIYHLAQRNFYAFLNMEEVGGNLVSMSGEFPGIAPKDRKILGTKVCSIANIPIEKISSIRDSIALTDPRCVRVADGGWHFGYMGGYHETDVLERIGFKVKAAAHQEYNEDEILRSTMNQLILGHDIFGRNAVLQQVAIDNSFPQYLREHLDDYRHLILPPITATQRLSARLDLSVGRFMRKAIRKIRRMLKL